MSNNDEEKKASDKPKERKHRINGFEEWGGYMASKKMKLAAQFAGQRDIEIEDQDVKSVIFKGVSIFVNGYTKPSADELKRLMLIHGGIYHHYFSSKTTHTIASNLPYSKIKNLKNQIIVRPDWITDSIKAGKLLPHQDYFLYPPEVLHKQPRLKFESFTDSKTVSRNDLDMAKKTFSVISSPPILNQDTYERSCFVSEPILDEFQESCFPQKRNSFSSGDFFDDFYENNCSQKNISMNNKDIDVFQGDRSRDQLNFMGAESCLTNSNFSNGFQDNDCLPKKNTHNSFSFNPESAHSKSLLPSKNEGPATAGHPAFLSEFYSHSRLHHISTAAQELKRYVQELVDSHGSKPFPGREHLKNLVKSGNVPNVHKDLSVTLLNGPHQKNHRVIMHLDMDCFFVSVGLRKHPELKGQPVAVTHSKGKRGGGQEGSDLHYEASHYRNQSRKKVEGLVSVEQNHSDEEHPNDDELLEKPKISKYSKEYGSLSEIASCSYEARKAGVRNGMFLGEALRRCPNLKTVPYDFDGYSEVSKLLYDIVTSYTLDVEAVSCDELYIDCTDLLYETGISPLQFASILRLEIEQKTKCTASAGLGANMLLARLANKTAKPNGQYYVANEQIEEFMMKQKVKDLPGVGYSTSAKFEHMGIITCEDLQKWSLSKLQQEFGPKTGQTMYKRCRGKDHRTVQLQKERKSVSAEINYGIRFEKEEDAFKFLKELSVEVVNRLNNINSKAKSITLKLMIRHPDAPVQTAKFMGHGVCDHIVKSVSLKSATNDALIIGHECCMLARSLKIKPDDYRGVGIQLSKLEAVHKDTRNRSIDNFLFSGAANFELENKEIFSPKELEPAHKPLPKGSTIKDFLSDKPSSSKHQSLQPLSVDQLDKSVLNALPEHLQKEVLEMCENKTSKTAPLLQHSSSSSSHSSLPSFKSSKIPPKKDSASIKDIPAHKKKTLNKQNTLLDCMISTKNDSKDDQEEESVLKKKATIGGAENINEVRSLVKEWVLSSQVVLEEDIDQFRDYVLQVIDEDLKKVDLILKYFHRVVSTANTLWQQAYLTILSYVQQKMLQKYGTMLDAKSEFSI